MSEVEPDIRLVEARLNMPRLFPGLVTMIAYA